ncbi:MAG: transcriptional repressor [Endomicrobia bacterium]|nr:transcriptional repressor [Endomicrobiia bacterium]
MTPKDVLKIKNIRLTIQKVNVYEYLRTHRNHPDAEQIYTDLSKMLPTISRATVYNVLKEFVEKHIIIAIAVEHKLHYDAYLDHSHLLCEKCNKLYDLNIPPGKIEEKEVDGHTVRLKCELYKGVCKNCKAKIDGKPKEEIFSENSV